MKKFIKKCFVAIALLIMLFTTLGNSVLAENTIRINSESSISVIPDKAKISIDVVSEKPTVEEAQEASNHSTKEIIDAILSLDIPKENITTSEFQIVPEYNYQLSGSRSIKSYRVIYSIGVTLDDINKLGNVIDISIKNGATNAYNIEYSYSKYDEVYIEALKEATKKGNLKAKAIADSSGTEIINIISIEEIKPYNDVYMNYKSSFMADKSAEGAQDMQIMSGNMIIRAEVNIEYNIK